jgi:hypothetical protein
VEVPGATEQRSNQKQGNNIIVHLGTIRINNGAELYFLK